MVITTAERYLEKGSTKDALCSRLQQHVYLRMWVRIFSIPRAFFTVHSSKIFHECLLLHECSCNVHVLFMNVISLAYVLHQIRYYSILTDIHLKNISSYFRNEIECCKEFIINTFSKLKKRYTMFTILVENINSTKQKLVIFCSEKSNT